MSPRLLSLLTIRHRLTYSPPSNNAWYCTFMAQRNAGYRHRDREYDADVWCFHFDSGL